MAGTLIARELHKAHGAATILAGVSVTVAPGDVLGVVGPNGAGKTTLLRMLAGIDKPVPWQGFTSKGPTRVGDNVWCGANVVITSGVTIGRRSVIGANSVVTTDLPPYSIAAGAPAKVLREVTYPDR